MDVDSAFRAVLSLAAVMALLAGLAWLARRGGFRRATGAAAIAVETATALGERRTLVIVAVEGRRLLLGLTPGSVSLVTELAPVPAPTPTETAR
jgi:flagellar protein FliO/FliZ